MKKSFLFNFTAITAVLFLSFSIKVFADTATTTELINAEILSSVWYSTTTINENDSINIYAGSQNHSQNNLSGAVGFFVDNVQISKTDFISAPKTLLKLEARYVAKRGAHNAQAKILDIAEIDANTSDNLSVDNLLSKETEKNNFSVKYVITKEEIINNTNNMINNILNTVNIEAEKAANYVENLKEPSGDISSDSVSKTLNSIVQNKIVGKVLGTNIENTDNAEKSSGNYFSIKNILLDGLAFVIRNWIWSLIIVVIAVLFISFK